MHPRPFASRGHGAARWLVDVRVSPSSRAAYLALLPGTALPDGTLLAAFHHDPGRGRPGPIYVMEKEPGGWQYTIVDPEGSIRRRGGIELCARCHAEAVAYRVFGLSEPIRSGLDAGGPRGP